QAPSENAAARAFVHDEIKRQVLNKEFDPIREASLIEGVQHRVAGPVGGSAGAPSHPSLAISQRMTTEGPLIDLSALGARERYAKMLELDDRRHRVPTHVFDRVLVTEPVGSLDGVVHVPAPIVLAHVAKRRADPTLRRGSVAAGRNDFADAGSL